MANTPNKLSQFWQELKRRKVIHVVTVYAGAAFVIIELINNVTEPLKLPEWTPTLVIIILLVGFPLAVIFSWIYDIHPEKGIVETEQASDAKADQTSKSSSGWKIASYISFVVIVGLIILNIIPRSGKNDILYKSVAILPFPDKSIAVLPFRNDSPDEEKMYFINGTMEAILNNLCKVEDLRVVSRTTVEQYRNTDKTTPIIAGELNVGYLLEGSGQKVGERVLLTVQLIDGVNDQHVWSKQYDREIRRIEDLVDIQSEIAQMVAGEIKSIVTPEEQGLIEKKPTNNLTAYDFYQRGEDELWKYEQSDDFHALVRAKNYFHKALEHDSTFAQVYLGLADVYSYEHYWGEYFSEDFLDSFLILTNIALTYDNQLSKGYRFRGYYYVQLGNYEQALKEYNKAIELNPNDRVALSWIAFLYDENPVKQIETSYKALHVSDEDQKPASLRSLGFLYMENGFLEKARQLYQEALTLDADSFRYLNGMAFIEVCSYNFEECLRIVRKMCELDTSWMPYPIVFNFNGCHQEMCSIYERISNIRGPGWVTIQDGHRIGIALQKVGRDEEAREMFNREIQQNTEAIELGRNLEAWGAAYYDLGGAYACLGEKQKAIQYLKECNRRQFFPLWWVIQWKVDPLFENIREEPEYQQIIRDVEAKYQAEHERVRQWLEENDML